MTSPNPTSQSRTPAGVPTGGQFAASAKGEAGLGLDTPQVFAALINDSVTHLEARFPGIRAWAHDPETLHFEDSQGYLYAARFRTLARGEAVNVSPIDPHDPFGGGSGAHKMTDVDGILDSDDVVGVVGRTLGAAHKRRAYREHMEEFADATADNERSFAVDDDVSYVFGATGTDDYVRIGHYDYVPADPRPGGHADMLSFSLGTVPGAARGEHDADAQRFEVRRTSDGVLYLDNEGRRLAPWQIHALEAELAKRGAPSVAAIVNRAHHIGTKRSAEDQETAR